MKSKLKLKKGIDIFLFLCAIAACYCVCFYIFALFRNEITSDCTDTMWWAEAMITSGKLYSPTFRYAALIPFGGELLMYPFVKLFGVSMLAQSLSMLCFAILFTVCLYLCVKELFRDRSFALLSVFMMLAILCVSVKLREIFWGHIIYYSLGVLFFFVEMFLVCRIFRTFNEKNADWKWLAFLGLWSFLTATNGLLSLVQCILPVFGALVLQWCFNDKKNEKLESLMLTMAAMLFLCSVAGYLAGNLLKGDLTAGYANAYSSFEGSTEWTNNLMKLIPQWYTLLGVKVKAGEHFMSVDGIFNLIRIAYATLLVIIPVIMMWMLPKIKEIPVRLLVFSHWIMTGIIMMGYVFGRLSGGNWRLSPLLCSSVLLLAAFVQICLRTTDLRRFGCLMAVVCVSVNLLTVFQVSSMNGQAYKKENVYYGLAEFLEENDLEYGYATFWHSNVITLLSDSKVRVRNVEIDGARISKGYYQSEAYWFDEQEGVKDYFLLLTKNEFVNLTQSGCTQIEGYYKYLEYSNYYILVFDSNIRFQ